jgi:hypothetical protein
MLTIMGLKFNKYMIATKNKYITSIPLGPLYEFLKDSAKLFIKATDGTFDERVSRWASEYTYDMYAESNAFTKDNTKPLFNEEAFRVKLDYIGGTVVAENLYTYVLLHGCYIPPWEWIYDKHYYDEELDITFFYDYGMKKYRFEIGRMKKVPRKRKAKIDEVKLPIAMRIIAKLT